MLVLASFMYLNHYQKVTTILDHSPGIFILGNAILIIVPRCVYEPRAYTQYKWDLDSFSRRRFRIFAVDRP